MPYDFAPAFSGLGRYVNSREAACLADWGPIPPGTYYIFDREVGGRLGSLLARLEQKVDWFALYAIDEKIDDETYCNKVRRGEFRLHHGSGSKGCITIANSSDFQSLRTLLRRKASPVPGSKLLAYGKLVVT